MMASIEDIKMELKLIGQVFCDWFALKLTPVKQSVGPGIMLERMLTHWGLNKMMDVLQMVFYFVFSWM